MMGNGSDGLIRLPPDKRHHITLVDEQHDKKLSQITRPMWEPTSELQAEKDMLEAFFRDDMGSPGLSPARMREIELKLNFWQQWMDNLFINSNSVEGWKNNSMEKVLTHSTQDPTRSPAAKVAVEDAKTGVVKRGLWD